MYDIIVWDLLLEKDCFTVKDGGVAWAESKFLVRLLYMHVS
jgi:hypothetical protein